MPSTANKRRIEDEVRRPKKKPRKFKKQKEYHSSSEDESDEEEVIFKPQTVATGPNHVKVSKRSTSSTGVSLEELSAMQDVEEEEEAEDDDDGLDEVQINTAINTGVHDDSEDEEDEGKDELLDDRSIAELTGLDEVDDDDDDDEEQDDEMLDEFDSDDPSEVSTATGAKKKRNDPTAFATSISKILTTKLSTQKRVDPILSRSKTADEANKALADGKLEAKARASIRAERRSLMEKGRVKDVLGLESSGIETGAIMEEEKRLKKTAQRGVVKLFNAVRAAQVKAEEAERSAKDSGMVGMSKREDRINEMSKEGFLDLISRGGKTIEA